MRADRKPRVTGKLLSYVLLLTVWQVIRPQTAPAAVRHDEREAREQASARRLAATVTGHVRPATATSQRRVTSALTTVQH